MAKNASRVRGQTAKAKSQQDMTEVLRETTKLWRKHHLSYDQSRYVVEQVRLAGHPAPIMCVDGVCSYPNLVVGPPVGVDFGPDADAGWVDNVLATPKGSSVLLYTDGLLDAYSTETVSDTLGIVELVAAVQTCLHAGDASPTWISRLVGNAPRQSVDDTAVVVLAVEGR